MARMSGLPPSRTGALRGYAEACLLVAASTLAGLALAPSWGNSAVDLLYLPAVLGAAILAGLGASLFAAQASALAYNFFITAPHFTFRIENPNDIVTVGILFAVAAVSSQLAASVRKQARIAEAHAARNATIAGLARRLLACSTEDELHAVATSELAAVFECNAVLIGAGSEPPLLAAAPSSQSLTPGDLAVAALVLDTGERAGRGVDRAIPTEWQFHPVRSGSLVVAVMGLARGDGAAPVRSGQQLLLDNLLDQVALALERARLEGEAREFARIRERDQVRSVLLSSIGHDLSPRLRAISDAARELRRSGDGDRTLVSGIGSESARIEQYLTNLLALGPDDDQQPIEVGGITIDLFRHAVLRDGAGIHLTPKEFALLAELTKHRGRVLTHGHLLRTIWGPAHEGQIDYLRVAIRALRQKLEGTPSKPELILNEPGIGYRLAPHGRPGR
jgi:two-component system sensor histidine kinase KdpD